MFQVKLKIGQVELDELAVAKFLKPSRFSSYDVAREQAKRLQDAEQGLSVSVVETEPTAEELAVAKDQADAKKSGLDAAETAMLLRMRREKRAKAAEKAAEPAEQAAP